ncbi:MAG: SIMPL domain-containing protein, partial [Patescibacteria group bacterium]
MSENEGSSNNVAHLRVDFRIISALLLAAIVVMFVIWKPWSEQSTNDRTIQVTGEATIKAEPDEFVFYPTYSFKNVDAKIGLTELTKKSDEIVAKLKALGVGDNAIKTNAADYATGMYYPERTIEETTYSLQITITLGDKNLSQKVQDYLLTTTPEGSISPQPKFSEPKKKTLEAQARDEATKSARAKADQSARNLGFKVGKVKSVADSAGFGVYPMMMDAVRGGAAEPESGSNTLTIQPGQNEL